MKISELKPGMKKVDLKGKIIELSEPREVVTRFGGLSRVATAVLADESGSIKLSLWNEDIDKVSVNDEIAIENGYVTSFRGEIQLNVGKYGKLSKEK
ncbi:MAG: OB-fold nucleic acid binding domain-containing protein [Candidatus Bathyarchaeia archaeon]